MPIIDSHHHFWKFTEAEYGWIEPSQTKLRRDFLPADLEREMRACGVDGAVSVQARQSIEETRWLLELAAQHDFIRGVVGWVPLVDADVGEALREFSGRSKKLRGVRHVLQGERDERYMLREDFNRGIAQLARLGLVYDILIFERHLPQTIAFVDRHPNQIFVLDHIAKPRIAADEMEPWRKNIRELARRPNVFCKASGMVTEADHATWQEAQLWKFFDTVVEAFTPRRLMFGSDWPVCLLGASYRKWFETVDAWIEVLSPAEQERIRGGTAIEVYGL